MVAGTAPSARTASSTIRAVSRFSGHGMPCVMMVDSSATTGRPSASAAATWSLITGPLGRDGIGQLLARHPW